MKDNNSINPKNKLLRLASSGLQLGVLIAGGTYGGKYLDELSDNSNPIFTIVGALLGVGVGLYFLYRTVIKLNNDN